MFTGIIEELGIVTSLVRSANSGKLTVSAEKSFSDIKTGESIAVNGACLTASGIRRNFIEFDISSETLKRTTLQDLKIGDKVNLERALLVAGRMGGHMVTGHVDGVGEIRKIAHLGGDIELHVSVPSELLRYLVPKGSIAVDGISLTLSDLREALVVMSVIPHTVKSTNIGLKSVGDRVNIEVDIISKYIERHLRGGEFKGISEDTLSRIGFLPMGWYEN